MIVIHSKLAQWAPRGTSKISRNMFKYRLIFKFTEKSTWANTQYGKIAVHLPQICTDISSFVDQPASPVPHIGHNSTQLPDFQALNCRISDQNNSSSSASRCKIVGPKWPEMGDFSAGPIPEGPFLPCQTAPPWCRVISQIEWKIRKMIQISFQNGVYTTFYRLKSPVWRAFSLFSQT